MAKTRYSGKCQICGKSFSKGSIGRHLATCRKSLLQGHTQERSGPSVHMLVEARGSKDYWLHLEASADMTLGDLDAFLRDIWLECCGHMSGFELPRPKRPMGIDFWNSPAFDDYLDRLPDEPGEEFDTPLSEGLPLKQSVRYTYDYGSSTNLTVKAVENYKNCAKRDGIALLARNEAPEIPCGVCGKPATKVCMDCSWEPDGWLCGKCAKSHECDQELMLPIPNSPRAGVCAYTGND